MKLLGEQLVHVDVRPMRAAFLVRPRSRADFRTAIERACSRWGGQQELIVPVSPKGVIRPIWRACLQELQPDLLFEVAEFSSEVRDKIYTEIGVRPQSLAGENLPSSGCHPLVVDQSGLGNVVRPSARHVTALAACGDLAAWEEPDHWREAGVRFDIVGDPFDLAAAQLEHRTVSDRTVRDCGEVMVTGGIANGIAVVWIAEPTSLTDALWFWNLRALAPLMRRAAWVLTARDTAMDPRFVRALWRSLESSGLDVSPDVAYVSLTEDDDVLHAARVAAGLERFESGKISARFGPWRDARPRVGIVNPNLASLLIGRRLPGRRASVLVRVADPTTVVRSDSPVAFRRGGGHIRVRYSGGFFTVPPRQHVPRLFHRDAILQHGELEIESSAMNAPYQFAFEVPGSDAIIEAAVRSAGFELEPSPPGRLAEGVLAVTSDRDQFADPRAAAVIAAMTTPRSRSLTRQLAEHVIGLSLAAAERVAGQLGSQMRQAERRLSWIASQARLGMADTAAVLDGLLASGLVVRGLVVACDVCGLHTFADLSSGVATIPTCPGCRSVARFEMNNAEPAIYYRLNSLLDRASDQGVLPHLFAFARLGRGTAVFGRLGVLVRKDGRENELDVLLVRDRELLVGEAKSASASFTIAQVKRDIGLAAALAADSYVMVCLQDIPDPIVEAAHELADDHGLGLEVVCPE